MLELPNFGHMTTSTTLFEWRDKILMVKSWAETMTSYPLFQVIFISRRSRVAIFADIIKIITMFIKTISISAFLDIAKFADFQYINADASRIQGLCHVIHIFFGSSLGKV